MGRRKRGSAARASLRLARGADDPVVGPSLLTASRTLNLLRAGEFALTHFADGRDEGLMMAADQVTALAASANPFAGAPGAGGGPGGDAGGALLAHPHDVLIGCADRVVRLVQASRVACELGVEGAVTALAPWGPEPPSAAGGAAAAAAAAQTPRFFAYGCATGEVGLIALRTSPRAAPTLERLWSFRRGAGAGGNGDEAEDDALGTAAGGGDYDEGGDEGSGTGGTSSGSGAGSGAGAGAAAGGGVRQRAPPAAGVSGLVVYPISGAAADSGAHAGAPLGDLVVSREDGAVEVWGAEAAWAEAGRDAASRAPLPLPRLLAAARVGESVRALAVGCVSTPGVPDIVVATFRCVRARRVRGRFVALSSAAPPTAL
jgi:hypothetical protein